MEMKTLAPFYGTCEQALTEVGFEACAPDRHAYEIWADDPCVKCFLRACLLVHTHACALIETRAHKTLRELVPGKRVVAHSRIFCVRRCARLADARESVSAR